MTLNEIVTLVINRTTRIDQQAQIESECQFATLMLHNKFFDRRDMLTVDVDVTPAREVKVPTPVRWRRTHAMYMLDALGVVISEIVPKTTKTVVMEQGLTQKPHYSTLGTEILITSGTTGLQISKVAIEYYASALVSDLTKSTWLTEHNPQLVAHYVTHIIHSQNGNKEKANEYLRLFDDAMDALNLV